MVANPNVHYTNTAGESTLRVEIQLITTITSGRSKTLDIAPIPTRDKVFYLILLYPKMRMAIGVQPIWTIFATMIESVTKSMTMTASTMVVGSCLFNDSSLSGIENDTRFV